MKAKYVPEIDALNVAKSGGFQIWRCQGFAVKLLG
jgi:hypothetical protein